MPASTLGESPTARSAGDTETAPTPLALRHLLRPLRADRLDRQTLIDHVRATWHLTDWLFQGIPTPADLLVQPEPLRNPLIFYLGHSASFWLNKLILAGLLDDRSDAGLRHVFAVGVDPARPEELDNRRDWPSFEATTAFRRRAFERVMGVLSQCALGPCDADSPSWSILMGLEHERIHFETSSVLIRQMPLDTVSPPPGWRPAPSADAPPAVPTVRFEGGTAEIGRPATVTLYGWDNEYGRAQRAVAPFEARAHLTTCAEFAEFVDKGGYRDPRWWSAAGWRWVQAHGRTKPEFWRGDAADRRLRTVFREIELPGGWPVEVNHYEAEAWCRFVGARLPSEAEYRVMIADAGRRQGGVAFDPVHHHHLAACSPRGVLAGAPTPHGLHDPAGNVWQWLSDDFHPLPGFRPNPLYPDFSAPYFGADHKMLAGGSWASTGTSASEWYRLWFRPCFFQHAGFRAVWSA